MDILNTTASTITTPLSEINQTYCKDDLNDFRRHYRQYHGYISAFVCIFGIIGNILNIIVLTRKHMISSMNTLLTGLAVADTIVMLDYLPFTIDRNLIAHHKPLADLQTYSRMVLYTIRHHVFIVAHAIAIAFTLTLAIWRYIAVNYPLKASHWCNMHRTRVAIGICVLLPIILYIPGILSVTVKEYYNGTFVIDLSDIASSNNLLYFRITFWTYSVLTNFIPCIVLTILSFLLVRSLHKAEKMMKELIQRPVSDANDQHRTTKMLLVVLVLFLVTEFTNGVIQVMAALYAERFYLCYEYFIQIGSLIIMINSAVNFVIYCTMSRRFRETFVTTFKLRICSKWKANDVAKSHEVDTQMSEMTTSM